MTIIPLVIAECCREWPMAPEALYPWGRCGLCGERPTFKHSLPEEDWLHVS